MSKIDPRLKFIQENREQSELTELQDTGRFAVESTVVAAPTVKVLLQFEGDLPEIEALGFEPRTVANDIASGVVDVKKLDKIAELDAVVKIESSRPMLKELDVSVPEVRGDQVHTGPPSFRGSGVIAGIIDSGIDYTHQVFRKSDGSSRILAIWDQGMTPTGSESSPSGYTYGVEYTKSDIDAALLASDPFSVVRHRDRDSNYGHGTHVTGIAAGDGSLAGNGQPAFTFVGLAPEADIIVVANSVGKEAIGDSANTLDAVKYLFDKAAASNKPVVINESQGDNLGPHDGTSLLERGIDNLLGGKGRAMVKSAGNAADGDIHANGTVPATGVETVQFAVPKNDADPDTIDIWYSGSDRFSITITPPGGAASTAVAPGTTINLKLSNGNRAFVDSVLNDPNNGDNRIYIQLSRGTKAAIQQGTWSFSLQAVTVTNGHFDAWIERGRTIPAFIGPHRNNSRTISVPGTSKEVITVASYITKGAGAGNISAFSSRGPTRDGRQAPTIGAPGQAVMSARAVNLGSGEYHLLRGTSMSAPHVAGAIALMFEKKRDLTQAEIVNCLTTTARSDTFTGTVPNMTWGHGKLDVKAAVDCVSAPVKVKFLDDLQTLKFRDDLQTLKFRDDLPKFKFRDDLQTLKFRDDLQTLKFRDDPQTLKFRDGPTTLKFRDDGGTDPRLDPVKQPGLDSVKQPGLDRQPAANAGPAPGSGPAEAPAAPFVLATPHHSEAWRQSFPAAAQADYLAAIREYEETLTEMYQAHQQGQLTPEEQQQLETLSAEYEALLAEYQQMIGEGRR